MSRFQFAPDTFGDPFTLDQLPLPRDARGYAVQALDTDTLLDCHTGAFLPMRSPALNGLFNSFAAAHAAASNWVDTHCATLEEHRLAIVPAGFDDDLQRHILIYGVLCGQP